MAVAHGRGAGVIGEPLAVTSHCPMPTIPRRRRCRAFRVEIAALLDVQLDVGRDVALRALARRQLLGIATEERDALADASCRCSSESPGRPRSARRSARGCHRAALFVLEDHHLERVLRDEPVARSVRATSMALSEPTSPS